MMAKRFRKLPIQIEAVQWTGDNIAELNEFAPDAFSYDYSTHEAAIWDKLHSSWVTVYPNQWVIRGVKDEFYPIADDVLAETYEAL